MTIKDAILKITTVVIDPIISLIFAAALLYFFWGIFTLVMKTSTGDDASNAKMHIMYALIGMVIMFSVGGIVNLISNTIGADNSRVNIEGGL